MPRRSIWLISLALIMVLAACGGEQETQDAESAQSAASEPATATATLMPTATTRPTDTPEPEPSPTLAPTPTPEAVEADQSEQDQDEGQEDTASTGSGWGISGSEAQTACDHPYLPLRPGATWNYQTSEQQVSWEVLDVQGDSQAATAVLGVTAGNVTIEYLWDCVAGEGIASFDFANLGVTPTGTELTIEQAQVDGQFLLPPEQLVSGATWTTNLDGEISFLQEAGGTTVEATGDMTTAQQNTVLSAEPVEFEGQTLAGLQIEQLSDIILSLSVMGNPAEQNLTITNEYELGYGVGIIKQSSITNFGTETMTLLSYSIP